MYVVIESWTPNAAFLNASVEVRAAFFEALGAGMEQMAQGGITTLGWGRVDPGADFATNHDWFAVWQMPDTSAADAFLGGVAASAWYEYFDQTNIRGELRPVGEVIGEHMALNG